MKVTAYTKDGKVTLDLTVAKDIATFGGQAAADAHIRQAKIQAEVFKVAEKSLIDKGEITASVAMSPARNAIQHPVQFVKANIGSSFMVVALVSAIVYDKVFKKKEHLL